MFKELDKQGRRKFKAAWELCLDLENAVQKKQECGSVLLGTTRRVDRV